MGRTHVVVTAGPTRERIDPVRFISNYSTGTFGYAIAAEARHRGYRVTLVSGPTALKVPAGVKVVRVESALEMLRAVRREWKTARGIIMAAAVSDWRVCGVSRAKIKKGLCVPSIRLTENPDIVASLKTDGGKVKIGFALESGAVEKRARMKLKAKGLDMIVANAHGRGGSAFGNGRTSVCIMMKDGTRTVVRGASKGRIAKILLDKAASIGL